MQARRRHTVPSRSDSRSSDSSTTTKTEKPTMNLFASIRLICKLLLLVLLAIGLVSIYRFNLVDVDRIFINPADSSSTPGDDSEMSSTNGINGLPVVANDKPILTKILDAESLLDQGKIETALTKFEFMVSSNPASPRAKFGMARALGAKADLLRSNEILQKSIIVYGKTAELFETDREMKKLCYLTQHEKHRFLGHNKASVVPIERLVLLYPGDVEILNKLGVSYLIAGMNNKAKPIFETVLRKDPDDGFAKAHLGFILKLLGQFEEAVSLLKQGIASHDNGTNEAKFYYHLGDAVYRLGNHDDAYAIYQSAAELGLFNSMYQRSMYNVANLKAQPWWDSQDGGSSFIDAVDKLESNWKLILEEVELIVDEETGLFEPESEGLRDTGNWRQFTLFQQGRKNENNCLRTPKTCAVVESIPDASSCKRGQVKFSIMQPGTHVWPHCGPTNCRIRAHLGLIVPDNVRIRVAHETRTWSVGKVIIFDDSFEHEVWHDGRSLRLVLIVDLWHPELTARQRRQLTPI